MSAAPWLVHHPMLESLARRVRLRVRLQQGEGMIRYYEELPLPLRLLVILGGSRLVLAYEEWRVSNQERERP